MHVLKNVYLFLCKLRDLAIIGTMVVIIGVVIMQIFLRYVATGAFVPFAWGNELIQNLSSWVFFLGASLAAREGAHISLNFLKTKLFKGKAGLVVDKIIGVICLITLGAIVIVGFQSALDNPASMVNLPSVPMTAFFLSIPVGMSFVFVDFLLVLIFGYHPFSKKALAEAEEKKKEQEKEGE